MAVDYDLPFRIHETSPFEDVEYKMDMLVEFTQGWNRGVEVERKRNRLGVQLTASTSEQTLAKKKKQIKHGVFQMKHQQSDAADDVVLVSLGINQEVRQAYDQWRKNQDGSYRNVQDCDPRGPEQFLSDKTKHQMLLAVIDKLPPHLQVLTQQIASQISGMENKK